jgi:hypothetical protein
MDKYGIEDLVTATVDQKPMDFETAFNDIVIDRIRTAIETKKMEVATALYQDAYDVQTNETEEPEYGEDA